MSRIPSDIWLHYILHLLDIQALFQVSCVNKHLNGLVNKDFLWKHLCFKDLNISQDTAFHHSSGWKKLYKNMTRDTKVFTWGENNDGRLGLNESTELPASHFQQVLRRGPQRFGGQVCTPQEVRFLQDKSIVDIVSGGWSFHALDKDGAVWMWGTMQQEGNPRSNYGTRRVRNPTCLQTDNTLQPKIKFSSISSGRGHAIGITRDGESVWHWSNHVMLQSIDLSFSSSQERVVQVSANWNYSSVLTNTGSVYIIPKPDLVIQGQVPEPTMVTTGKVNLQDLFEEGQQPEDQIVQIVGIDKYTIALTRQGRVLKLETDDADAFSASPRQHVIELVHFGANIAEDNKRDGAMKRFITGSFDNFAVYTRDGEVLLGTRDARQETVPEKLKGLEGHHICKVSFGDYHRGALTTEGKLFTWGNYSSGALGQGQMHQDTNESTPKMVDLKGMFVFAIGFGGWQSSAIAIPDDTDSTTTENQSKATTTTGNDENNFIRIN